MRPQHRDRGRPLSLLQTLLLASILCGCDFPFPSSKYEVTGTSACERPPTTDGFAGAGSIDSAGDCGKVSDLDPPLRRLVEAFAGDDEACGESFAANCSVSLSTCGASEDCVRFGECVRERASPTAETTCTDDLGTSMDDHWNFELLRHCWATRYAECPTIGTVFTCAGNYGPPSAERSEVSIRQQLLFYGQESVQSTFGVSLCPEFSDCTEPDTTANADPETGIYEAVLRVGGKNSGVGHDWKGYRLIQGPDLPDSIVETNLPLWGRRVEITRLFNSKQVETLRSTPFNVDANRALFAQIVDCQSDPAAGIIFEVPTAPGATITYVNENALPVPAPTASSGAVGIGNYDPEELQSIVALKDGTPVASWRGLLTAGRSHYLRLHPDARK